MPNLVISSSARAYSDKVQSNAPLRQNFNWVRATNVSISNPRADEHTILAGASWTFFDGTESTSIDGTTTFNVTNPFTGIYRFTAVSGTPPVFRTDRGLTLTGQNVTVGVNTDATATFSLGGGTWGSVAAGDTLFLPGPITGDGTSPFSVMNQGFWTVLAVISSTVLQVVRPNSEDFQGANETIVLTSNVECQAFTAAGVQIGDKVQISAAFAPTTQRTFTVVQIAPSWFEVNTTESVPSETGKQPGATGMVFYSGASRYLRIEADQEVSARLNGMSTDYLQVAPIQAGDEDQVGWIDVWVPCWKLIVVNKSGTAAVVRTFTGE